MVWTISAVAVASVFLLAACGSTASTTKSVPAVTNQSKSPYTINTILGLTGAESSLGQAEATALHHLQAYVNAHGGINGTPIRFSIMDNQSNPQVAVSLATPLILRKVPVLLNGSVGATDIAVDALVKGTGTVVFDLSPVYNPPRGGYVFGTATALPQSSAAIMNFIAAKGWTRVDIVTTTDVTGKSVYASFVPLFKEAKYRQLHLVGHQTYADSAVTVSTQMAELRVAHPQVVIAGTTGAPFGVFSKGLQQASLSNIPVITVSGNATYSLMSAFKGTLPAHLYFDSQRYQAGLAQLSGAALAVTKPLYAAYDGKVGSGAGFAWDPALVILDALRHLGTSATAAQIHAFIEKLSNFQGVMGDMDFVGGNQRGYSISAIRMTEWDAKIGRFVGVSGPAGIGAPRG